LKIKDALLRAKEELKGVCDRPLFEAEILLSFALKKDRLFLHLNSDMQIDEKEFFKYVKRRANYEPIEYITKSVSFYSENFFIDYGALIPRPETEILIDELSKELKGSEKVLEIGIGSGVISIILKKRFPNLDIVATDISPKALEIAKKNIEKFELDIKLVQTNLMDNLEKDFDIIVSNPPYIKNSFALEKNVKDYEPKEALFGGEVGDEILKEIIKLFKESRAKILACEIGYEQKDRLKEDLKGLDVRFYRDLAGFDRGFIAKKKERD
jgi:release factor glutamine methyltransferase